MSPGAGAGAVLAAGCARARRERAARAAHDHDLRLGLLVEVDHVVYAAVAVEEVTLEEEVEAPEVDLAAVLIKYVLN